MHTENTGSLEESFKDSSTEYIQTLLLPYFMVFSSTQRLLQTVQTFEI